MPKVQNRAEPDQAQQVQRQPPQVDRQARYEPPGAADGGQGSLFGNGGLIKVIAMPPVANNESAEDESPQQQPDAVMRPPGFDSEVSNNNFNGGEIIDRCDNDLEEYHQ